MGIETALIAAAVVAAGSAAYSGYAANDNGIDQEKAQAQAKEAALKQEGLADQANNRANQKKPDVAAIMAAAQNAAKGGTSGTMLTGPQGVSNDALSLGKNTLLGQ